jgi:hypothetical protein
MDKNVYDLLSAMLISMISNLFYYLLVFHILIILSSLRLKTFWWDGKIIFIEKLPTFVFYDDCEVVAEEKFNKT